ncbi:hypothetical protein CA13_21680 [Planctomycetes bacterium CA13]|uniref:BNR/Asp-box repeat protein n=1 Tax=Novipirellula herctigrandis TaxID=2527986 RepID=A0A5C5Z007_9BACT|nr:hypothetical protein CA13_21680 [Planctomycetes bacterium CA13]
MTSRFTIAALSAVTVFSTLAASTNAQSASYDRTADQHGFIIFMEEGGWCWYQDPRSIMHDGKLFIGSVKGNGSGSARVGVYDLKTKQPIGTATMRDNFQRDDHNSPVFFARPDGSVLAVYALHGNDKLHRYRISDPDAPLRWSEEKVFDHNNTLAERDGVTYMNLYNMSSEGKLYNFYRGFQYNPCFITSTDAGLTWGEDTHFIKSEVVGYQRPYVRYAGNGIDTVHVSFTDAHPRNFGNSIYYTAFRDGKYFRADGTLIKDLKQDGPLVPSEAELVYKGNGKNGIADNESEENRAWTAAMTIDAQGHPHIGYTVHLFNEDHRFRIASWDGKQWHDRQVAFAGKCLYTAESSYTGLISLDPKDPSIVVISTDVDPTTGKDGGGKHEIYRAKVGLRDDVNTIEWEAVTKDSPVRNLRPMVVCDGETRVILWNRGDFKSYTDFQLDTIGLVESVK